MVRWAEEDAGREAPGQGDPQSRPGVAGAGGDLPPHSGAAGEGDPRRRLGAAGEALAARHLEALGLEIIDRNFRTRFGELDLVASDERYLVFCEVKTRIVRREPGPAVPSGPHGGPGPPVRNHPLGPFGPLTSIGPRKRRQVRAMAREWLATGRAGDCRAPEIRFDAIGISVDTSGRLVALEHLEAAF